MLSFQNPNHNTQFRFEGLIGLAHSALLPEPDGHVTKGQQKSQDKALKENVPKRKRSFSPLRTAGNRLGIHIEHWKMKAKSP